MQEGGSIDKISFTGPDIGPPALQAALDMMAGYPAVKNLGCWGCSLGDQVCALGGGGDMPGSVGL